MFLLSGYQSTLSSVFKFRLPGLQDNFILRDLVRSFELECPLRLVSPPAWDLVEVLSFLRGPTFDPFSSRPLQVMTMKVLFLVSLSTAKQVGELQAVSFSVAFQGNDRSLSYLLELVAKTESEHNPIPRSFLVRSLAQFVGELPDKRLLCHVRTIRIYWCLRPPFRYVLARYLSRQGVPLVRRPRMHCHSSCVRSSFTLMHFGRVLLLMPTVLEVLQRLWHS